jgi:hypothetical protein
VSKALKDASPALSSLATLVLGGNAISADGARALAQALPLMSALQDLQLPGNYLGDMGVCALSKAAAGLPHLRSLHLQVRARVCLEGRSLHLCLEVRSPVLRGEISTPPGESSCSIVRACECVTVLQLLHLQAAG